MMAALRDARGLFLKATDGKLLMATRRARGSVDDFAMRLRLLLPRGWFPAPEEEETAPVLNAVLQGFGSIFAQIWHNLTLSVPQMRLTTMTGAFLDMASTDYFGPGVLMRAVGETDANYRRRMMAAMFARKNTRAEIEMVLMALTGETPVVIEPMNVADCGAWGRACSWGAPCMRYGSLSGGQFFVEARVGRAPSSLAVANTINQTKAAGVNGWIRIKT